MSDVTSALGSLDLDRIEDEEQEDFVEELEALGTTTVERRRDLLDELDRIETALQPGGTKKIAGFLKRQRLKNDRARIEAKLQRNATVLGSIADTVVRAQGLPGQQAEELEERGVEPEEATAIAFEGQRTPEARVEAAGQLETARREAAADVALANAAKVFGSEEAALDFDQRYQEAQLAALQAQAASLTAAAERRGEELPPDQKAMLTEMGKARAATYLYYSDQGGDRPNVGDPGLRAVAYNGREDRDDFRQNNKTAWDRVTSRLGRTEMLYMAEIGVESPENISLEELEQRDGLILAEQIDTGVFAGADVVRRAYRTELLRERGITTKKDMMFQLAYGIQNMSIGIDEVQEALKIYEGSDFNTGSEAILMDPEAIEWAFGADGTVVTNFTKADLDQQPLSPAWKERMLVTDDVTGTPVVLSLFGAWIRDRPFQRVYSREDLKQADAILQHRRIMELLGLVTSRPVGG
jgi:hypothetical protein